jgi:mRNA interferase RelE/StbE
MYKISIKKSAQKELQQISAPYSQKIIEAIDALAENPRPEGAKKLKGEEAYRIRVADYRVIYTIEDVIQIVEVQRIRHRKDAYKNL